MIHPFNAFGVLSCDFPGCKAQLQVGLAMTPTPPRGVKMEVVYLPENGEALPLEKQWQPSAIQPEKLYCPKHHRKEGS